LLYGAVLNGVNNNVWLASVDRSSGTQTLIGDTGLQAPDGVYGIGFASDGTLFATGPHSGGGGIWSLNLISGVATLQTTIAFAPLDMATQPMPVAETPIPEPSTWALFFGIAAGLVVLRLRKQE
jgi:hypothetical protein